MYDVASFRHMAMNEKSVEQTMNEMPQLQEEH